MTNEHSLPSGFEALERHLSYWDRPDSHGRWAQRQEASPDLLHGFYQDMVTHSHDAMTYLQDKDLGDMADADARLLRLVLAYMHASIAVEIHGQPKVPNAPYPHMVTIEHFNSRFR